MDCNINFYIDTEYDGDISGFDCRHDIFNFYLKDKNLRDRIEDKSVIHYFINSGNEDLIAYFSLSASCMIVNDLNAYSNMVSAIELKMFAINRKYQGINLSEKILDAVYKLVRDYSITYIGAKVLILYAVEEVVRMYEKSGFVKMSGDYSMYKSPFNEGCIPMYKSIEI